MLELHENAVALDPSPECQHLSDNVCAAPCRCLNRTEDSHADRIGYFAPQHLDRHHDRCKDVIEIMGNTAGERADAIHALCPQKLRRKVLFLCHITGHHDDAGNRAVTIPDHASLRVNGAFGPVLSQESVFDPLPNAGSDGFLKHLLYPCHIVRMDLLKTICSLQ